LTLNGCFFGCFFLDEKGDLAQSKAVAFQGIPEKKVVAKGDKQTSSALMVRGDLGER